MAQAESIKSFLVDLGFKVDEKSLKQFGQGIAETTKRVTIFAAVIEATAAAVIAGVTKIASEMEDLYYASARVGSSTSNILAYKFAVGQLGGSSAQAMQSMESLAAFFRSTPAAGALLESWGVRTLDAAGKMRSMDDIAEDLAKSLKDLPPGFAKARAAVVGWDEATMLMLQRGDLSKNKERARQLAKSLGVDPERLGEDAKNYQNQLREIKYGFELLGMQIESSLLKDAGPALAEFRDWFAKNAPMIAQRLAEIIPVILNLAKFFAEGFMAILGIIEKLDKATDGWSTRILALAAAFRVLGGSSAFALLAKAGAWLGLAGGAAVAGSGAVGYGIGTLIQRSLSEKTKDAIGGTIAEMMGGNAAGKSSPSAANPNINNPGSSNAMIEFFKGQGWTPAQAQGIAANLMRESGGKINAIGDQGSAYGLAQWHPDRQRNFAQWAGHDIRSSSMEEQMRFVQFELTQGMEKRAGDMLRMASNANDAAGIFSRNYERPANAEREAAIRGQMAMQLSQNTIINVSGSGDASAVAGRVANEQSRVNGDMVRNLKTAAS